MRGFVMTLWNMYVTCFDYIHPIALSFSPPPPANPLSCPNESLLLPQTLCLNLEKFTRVIHSNAADLEVVIPLSLPPPVTIFKSSVKAQPYASLCPGWIVDGLRTVQIS